MICNFFYEVEKSLAYECQVFYWISWNPVWCVCAIIFKHKFQQKRRNYTLLQDNENEKKGNYTQSIASIHLVIHRKSLCRVMYMQSQ